MELKMYSIILIIQYVSIVGLFVESWVIFEKWNNKLHSYLFFYCTANLINNVGYLMQLKATTEEAYITAMQVGYIGRVFIPFGLLLFSAELCGVKMPRIIKVALALIHIFTFAQILLIGKSDFYYKDISFSINEDGFPILAHKNSLWHHVYDAILIAYVIYGLVLLFVTMFRAKNKAVKKRVLMVIIAMFSMSAFLIIHIFKPIQIANVFDMTSFGYIVATVFLLIAIFRYDLLGTEQLAKAYIIDKLSEGIIAADDRGSVAYFNKPAETIFPKLGTDAPEVLNELSGAIESEQPIHIGDRIYTPKTHRLYSGSSSSGTVYVLQDNTELYKHAKELEEMTERAKAANEAKSVFLSSMSHEIRTPINAVLGMDEMILRESTEPGIISYAEDIKSAGNTLLSLINDILDFSKIEEGKMDIFPENYEPGETITDLVNMIKGRAEEKGLRFEVAADSDIPRVIRGDEVRIKQCVLNLLTNAVKYTEKGSVTFTVSFEREEDGNMLLRFTVKDTGIGMKPEDLAELFAPFERFDSGRNRRIEGTGLGMTITRRLLDLMGSVLEVKSVYGQGSEFSFAVRQKIIDPEPMGDLSERDTAGRRYADYHESFRAPDARLLAVDDTPVNLSVIKGLLKKTGIAIDSADSGREALRLAAENRYDIILLDHMMPEMDGIETLHELRGIPGYADTVCIALTANVISGAREMYLEAGFSDYLSKPVDSEKLEETLIKYLPPEKVTYCGDTVNAEADPELPAELLNMEGLDIGNGMNCCGTAELYLETLKVFADTAEANADEIERLLAAGDTAGATIKIHALKSTSRIIGANALSDIAKHLEAAGKENDTARLAAGADGMLKRYRALGIAIRNALGETAGETGEKTPISGDDLKTLYERMYKAAEIYDIDGITDIIAEISAHSLPESETESFRRLADAADNFDWGDIRAALSERLH
ncbi:MAG: response regulator [Ruminiclostridium sp.]|nr:response regulator [Ruminiclostridium sp.]